MDKKFKFITKKKINQLPANPGIYAFKNKEGILYIGKAVTIKDRVKQHKNLLDLARQIGYIQTNSEIEALILEANLIKKYQPKHNVIWKDDKNYFFVGVSKEDFPRVFITHQPKSVASSWQLVVRGKKIQTTNYKSQTTKYVGPFVDGKALKQTLKILRKVFPYRSCNKIPNRPCLWYHLNRCPAPCLLKISTNKWCPPANFGVKMKKECQRNTKNLVKILKEGKSPVLKKLKKEMKLASRNQDFEEAARIRDQISTLERVFAHARIFEPKLVPKIIWQKLQKLLQNILKTKKRISRIEAYDVSNIQGKEATGSMVTFVSGQPDKNFYRKFRIKFTTKPNDIAMLKEVLNRRFKHPEWPYPDLILIDGGKAQLNAALKIKNQKSKIKNRIRVISLAKRKNELFIEKRKEPILLKNLPREIFNLILQLRDEAHRFAISYHKKLREKELFDG